VDVGLRRPRQTSGREGRRIAVAGGEGVGAALETIC
jgi:hypothetical protein